MPYRYLSYLLMIILPMLVLLLCLCHDVSGGGLGPDSSQANASVKSSPEASPSNSEDASKKKKTKSCKDTSKKRGKDKRRHGSHGRDQNV